MNLFDELVDYNKLLTLPDLEIIHNNIVKLQQLFFISTCKSCAKTYTSISISKLLWNKYKYVHRNVLNNFILNPSSSDFIECLIPVFKLIEIHRYRELYIYEDEGTINSFKQRILTQKCVFNTKLMLSDSSYLLIGTGNEELYCKEYHGIIQSFILDYMNKTAAIYKLRCNIQKTELTIQRYDEMFKFYKNRAINAYQTLNNPQVHISINSSLFSVYENMIFKELNADHQIEMEKADEILFRANKEYLAIWSNIHNIRYDIVETYTDLHIWEENDNSINITSLVALVEYYKDDMLMGLELNINRGLCIPFLLLPTSTTLTNLLPTLVYHHPYAIPIFKTVNIPKSTSVLNLRNIINLKTLPVIHNTIIEQSKNNQCEYSIPITDDNLTQLFDEEPNNTQTTPNKKRKKSKRKKTTKSIKSAVDISLTTTNDIIELDDPIDEPVDDVSNDTSEDDEPIIFENIENVNNDTIVKFNKLPFNLIFYRYEYISYTDKDLITFMITDLYYSNERFKIFMETYDTIRIIQSFHKDYNAKDKSIHFNGIFYNTETLDKSSVYHFYVLNNKINTLTTIINII